MILMRPATMADSDNLFFWRNDPVTCANSRSTAPVPREDHDRWMQFSVQNGYPAHIVMIAEDPDHGCLGVVRFDAERGDVMAYEVGITLAPKHRGKHLANGVLGLACKYMDENTISAQIRADNAASRRVFEACGFEQTGDRDGFVNYRRDPS